MLRLVFAASLQKSDSFDSILEANRYSLKVEKGELAGTGAPVLGTASSKAEFILVGEDHGTAEIPTLVSAVCHEVVPAAFQTMAVETGALAARELRALD